MTISKRALSIAGALVIMAMVAATFSLVLSRSPESTASAEGDEIPRRVTVSGIGEVSVTPDTGIVTLGVEISDPDLATAQAEAAARMEAVIAAARAAGIAEQDITTGAYNIWVDRNWDSPEQTIRGYNVTHTVTIKVRDIDAIGAVIEDSLKAGANSVQGISFTVENPGDAVSQAREAAIEDARAKAEDLARLTGVSLGQVVTIDEYSYTPYPVGRSGEVWAEPTDGAAAPPINPGQSTISVQVQIAWELN